MGAIRDKFNTVFRDYNTIGIPATGDHEVEKAGVREAGALIEDSIIASNTDTIPGDEVLLATTGNVTLSGEQTIDGVLTSADPVLVKDNTDKTQNGPYITAAGAWTRRTTDDTGAELVGKAYAVTSGTVNGGRVYKVVQTAITVGVTDITFGLYNLADPTLAARVTELENTAITDEALRPVDARGEAVGTFLAKGETAVIGMAGTPATGSNAGASTYVFAEPLAFDAIIDTLTLYGSAVAADIEIGVFSRSNADLFTRVDMITAEDVPSGLKDIPVGMSGRKGQYLGITGSATGFLHFISATNRGYFAGTLSSETFTDTAITTNTELQAKFTIRPLDDTSDTEAELLAGRMTIPVKLGRPGTPVTGTNLASGTLVLGDGAAADSIIDSIDIFPAVNGTVRISIVERVGISLNVVRDLIRYTTQGAVNNNIPINAILPAGHYLQFQTPTVGAMVSTAEANIGFWYTATTTGDTFDDQFLSTGAAPQIRVNTRQLTKGQLHSPSLATVDRIVGIGDSYMANYYSLPGKGYWQETSAWSPYNFESIAVGGETYATEFTKLRANSSSFTGGLGYSMGYHDMGALYAVNILGRNDWIGGFAVSFDTFKETVPQVLETQRQAGAIPILGTETQTVFGNSSHVVFKSMAEQAHVPFIDLIPHVRKMNDGTPWADGWQGSSGADPVFHFGTRTKHMISDQLKRWFYSNLPRPRNSFKAYRMRATVTPADVNDLVYRDEIEFQSMFREIYINQVALNLADEDRVDDLDGIATPTRVIASEYLSWQYGNTISSDEDYMAWRYIIDATTPNVEAFMLFVEDPAVQIFVRSAYGFTLPAAPLSSCEFVELTGVDGLFTLAGNTLRGCVNFDELVFIAYKSGGFQIRCPVWSWIGEKGKPEWPVPVRPAARGAQLLTKTKFAAADVTEDKATGWESEGGTITPSTSTTYQLPYGITSFAVLDETLKARQTLVYAVDNYKDREIEIIVSPRNRPPIVGEGGSYPADYPVNLESFDYRRVIVELIDSTDTYVYDRYEVVGLWWDDIPLYSILPMREAPMDIRVYAEDDVEFCEVSVRLME